MTYVYSKKETEKNFAAEGWNIVKLLNSFTLAFVISVISQKKKYIFNKN